MASADGAAQVQVGGRMLTVPPECQSSLTYFKRDLAQRLNISGPAALQLFDSGRDRLNSDEDLRAALQEGRQPLQAALTAVALRDIEQRKFEVETKKEELAHFQWQIVVDQMKSLSEEVAGVGAQLQAVKDECRMELQRGRAEDAEHRERLTHAVAKDASERDQSFRDVEGKISALMQKIAEERTVRDVAVHQTQKQVDGVTYSFESERSARVQDREENHRAIAAIRHELEVEQLRNANNWSQHLEAAKRTELQLEARTGAEAHAQQGLQQLSADAEKMRASLAQLEASMALQSSSTREGIEKRSEELRKAVRDEMLGRENHFARLAKDLETAFQSLESRMMRARDESSDGTGCLSERARLLEQRCASLEQELSSHAEQQGEKERALEQQVEHAVGAVDSVEVGVKASDIVVRTTASKVESMTERLVAVESNLQLRPRHDFFKPQMDALQRTAQRMEAKVQQLEKDINSRFASEAASRDGLKAQMHCNVRDCLEKLGTDAVAAISSHGGKAAETVRIDIMNPTAGNQREPPRLTPKATGGRFVEIPSAGGTDPSGKALGAGTRPSLSSAAFPPGSQPVACGASTPCMPATPIGSAAAPMGSTAGTSIRMAAGPGGPGSERARSLRRVHTARTPTGHHQMVQVAPMLTTSTSGAVSPGMPVHMVARQPSAGAVAPGYASPRGFTPACLSPTASAFASPTHRA